jgi:hypothetical protein
LALGARFLARRVACCGSSRMRGQAPRACGAAPRRWASCCRFCRVRGHAPAPSALPPKRGRSRGFFNVCVLRQGASRTAMSFMRAPHANLDAQILAKKPTKLGGQRRASARKRGACSRILQNRHNEQNANRPTDAKSAPLLRRSRNTGGPRTSDSEDRGGRGGHVTRSARPTTRHPASQKPRNQRPTSCARKNVSMA